MVIEIRRITYTYCRVSTTKQTTARQDYGLRAYIQSLAGPHEHITEVGSGYRAAQPKLAKIITEIMAGRVSCLAFYDLSRLGRRASDLLKLRDVCREHNCVLYCVKMGVDFCSEIGGMCLAVLGMYAQMESETISERVSDGMAAGQARGAKYGSALIAGYKWISRKNKPKVRIIKDLASAGHTVNAIRRVVHMSEVQIKWIIETPEVDILTRKELMRRLRLPSQARPRS